MKREIKFRAFDPHTNRMYYNVLVGGRFVAAEYSIDDNYIEFAYHTCENGLHPDPFEVMQYVGKEDDNGNDIYELDIIRDGEGLRVVVFHHARFMSIPLFELDKFRSGNSDMWFANTGTAPHIFGAKVIGNIYENPELLNETKEV